MADTLSSFHQLRPVSFPHSPSALFSHSQGAVRAATDYDLFTVSPSMLSKDDGGGSGGALVAAASHSARRKPSSSSASASASASSSGTAPITMNRLCLYPAVGPSSSTAYMLPPWRPATRSSIESSPAGPSATFAYAMPAPAAGVGPGSCSRRSSSSTSTSSSASPSSIPSPPSTLAPPVPSPRLRALSEADLLAARIMPTNRAYSGGRSPSPLSLQRPSPSASCTVGAYFGPTVRRVPSSCSPIRERPRKHNGELEMWLGALNEAQTRADAQRTTEDSW